MFWFYYVEQWQNHLAKIQFSSINYIFYTASNYFLTRCEWKTGYLLDCDKFLESFVIWGKHLQLIVWGFLYKICHAGPVCVLPSSIIQKPPKSASSSFCCVETVAQNLLLINDYFKTISSHFLQSYINIFHEKEIQTVILRCWKGLYLNWFVTYVKKRSKFYLRFLPIL